MRRMLPVIGLGLLVVLLVFGIHALQSRARSDLAGALRALATRQGWTFTDHEDRTLWRLRGTTNGLTWVADARRPGPNDGRLSAQRTRLAVSRPGVEVYLGPKIPPGAAGPLALVAVEGFLPEAHPLLPRVSVVSIPGPLGVTHEARAVDEAAWRALPPSILPAFEALSRRHPVALVGHDGVLTLATGQCLTDAGEIERFVSEGLALAR